MVSRPVNTVDGAQDYALGDARFPNREFVSVDCRSLPMSRCSGLRNGPAQSLLLVV